MMKRVVFFLFVLLTFFSITAQAEESIDYLYNQSLVEHGNTNYQALAVISWALGKGGYDTTLLNEKLLAATYDQDTEAKAYALLATANTNLAAELAARQKGDGSWENSVFATALASYALLDWRRDLNTPGHSRACLISGLSKTQTAVGGKKAPPSPIHLWSCWHW